MKVNEEDETPVEKARYEGNYKDGVRCGVGKMVYPNGDTYEGEWLDNKVNFLNEIQLSPLISLVDAWGRNLYLQEIW
jgi:hypothetical protein